MATINNLFLLLMYASLSAILNDSEVSDKSVAIQPLFLGGDFRH
jgi:hypothetical protein